MVTCLTRLLLMEVYTSTQTQTNYWSASLSFSQLLMFLFCYFVINNSDVVDKNADDVSYFSIIQNPLLQKYRSY
ncbi:hypothetical protein DERP_003551 [Dermatophagoides pteronyssinus]|uniref:Uncharacterized protein n=1 Tax=Dermatophagoides pteronyssinus TaxID=6956 RepID=A0ABQ8JLH8_DERPT|nr:hypothetical protein DERP_003551 [Dermatophagoides pteronyssinus]